MLPGNPILLDPENAPHAMADSEELLEKLISGKPPLEKVKNLQVLAIHVLPFLKEDMRLAQIRYQDDETTCTTSWVWVGEKPDQHIELLDGPGLSSFVLSLGEKFNLTKETVIPYLRFISILTNYPLVERPEDIQWFTPLYVPEREELEKHLAKNPPQSTGSDDNSIEVEWCTIFEGKLLKLRGRIHTRTIEFGGLSNEPAARAGQFGPIHEEVLLSGFSSNSRYLPGSKPGSIFVEPIPDKDGWFTVFPEEAQLVAADINRYIFPILNATGAKVRRKWLEWYDIHLFEFEIAGPRKNQNYNLLWKKGTVHLLDGSSAPINDLNKAKEFQIDSEEKAARYVEFFCRYVFGEGGRFEIVTRPDHPCFTEFDHTEFAEGKTLESIQAEVGRLRFQAMEDGSSFECKGTHVFYADALFFATFEVSRDGLIKMTSDNPVMACRRREGGPGRAAKPSWAELTASDPAPGKEIRQLIEGRKFPDLLTALSAGDERQIEIKDKIVWGSVSLEGQKLAQRLVFSNCYFRGEVDLSFLTLEASFNIDNCIFDGGLKMHAAKIAGPLSISRSKILGVGETGGTLDLRNLSAGSLSFSECSIAGFLDASRSHIAGDVFFQNFQSLSVVSFEGATIDMDFRFFAADGRFRGRFRNSIGSYLYLERLRAQSIGISEIEIGGAFSIRFAVLKQSIFIGDETEPTDNEAIVSIGRADRSETSPDDPPMLSLYGTIVENNYVSFNQMEVHGTVECTFLRVGTGLFLNVVNSRLPLRIAGDLSLSGASLPGTLKITSTEIGGKLDARGIKAGQVVCMGRTVSEGSSIISFPVKVGKNICFADAEIEKEAFFLGIETGVTLPAPEIESMNLRLARIGGDLEFFGTPALARRFDKPSEPGVSVLDMICRFPNGINLQKIQVGGDLDLSGTDISSGTIDLSDAEITRDLKICRARGEPTRTRSLSIEAITCQGGMDLSGLSLVGGAPGDGDVNGKNASVKLQLRLCDGDAFASIPGRLDLGNSNLGELEVSEQTFKGDRKQPESINLGRANVGKLVVDVCDGKYPRPIKLGHSQIQWWAFRHGNQPPADRPKDYIKFLQGDGDIQRHTWRAVEESLYNRGMEDDADEIHKAMLKWLRSSSRPDLHWLNPKKWGGIRGSIERAFLFIWDWLTDSVTSWKRPAWIVVVWLIASTYFFSFRENIWSSEQKEISARSSPSEQQWGKQQGKWGSIVPGFWLALRHHVPIAHFTAEEEWKPRNDRGMWLWKKADGSAQECPVLTPEGYANLVIGVHLMLWPVIAVIASRKLLRRAKQ